MARLNLGNIINVISWYVSAGISFDIHCDCYYIISQDIINFNNKYSDRIASEISKPILEYNYLLIEKLREKFK
jgi:hypothetical protein